MRRSKVIRARAIRSDTIPAHALIIVKSETNHVVERRPDNPEVHSIAASSFRMAVCSG